jgi:hypothetical protein
VSITAEVDGAGGYSFDIEAAAKSYARRGWPVIPLYGVVDSDGSWVCECAESGECDSAGKHPRIAGWRKKATTNPAIISKWWRDWPNSNVGIPTGKSFGVVLDFDPRNGSDASLAMLEAAHGKLPPTLSSKSGGDGRHFIFAFPKGYQATSLPALDGRDGIDFQADGKLIVAPPSRHHSGNRYEWVTDMSAEILPLPGWAMLDLEPELFGGPAPEYVDPWTWAALKGECDKVANAKQGTRHDTLFVSAVRVGEVVAGGTLDRHRAIEYLTRAASACGLTPTEFPTILDGLKAGEKNPRRPDRAINSREEALACLEVIHRIFASIPWPGHRGIRMRACMEAMIQIARKNGGPRNFSTTLEQVAIESGRGRSSMQKAQEELVDAGWLHRKRKGYQGVPSRWDIRVPTAYKPLYRAHTNGNENEWVSDSKTEVIHDLPLDTKRLTIRQSRIPMGHEAFMSATTIMHEPDLFRNSDREDIQFSSVSKGLAASSWIVWDYLASEGGWHSQSEIARATGRHRSTVGVAVNERLLPFDLIEKGPLGVRAIDVTDEQLDNIAKQFRTHGKRALHIAKYRSLRDAAGGRASGDLAGN